MKIGDYDISKVIQILNEPQTPDDIFFFSLCDEARADILIVLSDFFCDIRNRQAVLEKRIWIEQDLELFLSKILYTALKAMDAADGSLILMDYDADELVFAMVKGMLRSKLRGYRFPKTAGVAGWVATHAEPLIVDRPRLDDRFYFHVDEAFGFETTSLICAPLVGPDKVIGVIEVLNKFSQQTFNEVDLDLLTILAHIAAEAIERMEHGG